MTASSTAGRTVALSVVADVALVLVFVLIGRSSHAEGFSVLGTLVTLWPFLAGLVVGWLATRAWRRPTTVLRAGIPIWIATVVIGMLLRVISGQGVQVSFVIVATIVLAIFLLGWRAIVAWIARARRIRRTGETA
jgi:peptidoglycan/LPS O-acetylase OafA/YrhL